MTPISKAKHPAQYSSTGQRGFTLLELLIVITIIVLSLGLIVPNLSVTENSAFRAEVRQAVVALNYARRIAIVQSSPAAAGFRTAGAQRPANPDHLPEERYVLWISDTIELGFQDEFASAPEPVTALEINFYPEGGSNGGVLHFAYAGRSASIKVDPITSRIALAYDDEEFADEF